MPRKLAAPKPKKKDAVLGALEVQGSETIAGMAARQMGEISNFVERKDDDYQGHLVKPTDKDHSSKFGEHVLKNLSGRGMKHDPMHISDHVVQTLQKGGALSADLLSTYVHGRVPAQQSAYRHAPVTNFHSESLSGGSLPAQLGFDSGGPMYRSPEYSRNILVV